MDPVTIAMLGSMGLNAIGGLFKKQGTDPRDRAEQQREFDANLRYQMEHGRTQDTMGQVEQLGGLNRQMEGVSARDKALFMINQRLGEVPDSFRPRDMMNPSISPQTPQLGGIDPRMAQHAMESYHAPSSAGAGSGGVDPRVYQALMTKLGMQSGPNGPSVGNVQIEQPSVPWERAPNPRMQGVADQQAAAQRAGAPTGYNPSYNSAPPMPAPNFDPGAMLPRRTRR